ncbi:hypothetical protein [Bacillus velezensis]|uniref:hypothetical protein n=1 Tax=Bacillus velezensis TaxID=492670 RepID=UPI00339590CE
MEELTIYEQIMKDPSFRKAALVKFGFGQVSPVKVEKWFKGYYPPKYHEFKQLAKRSNVTELHREAMTKEQRNKILDLEEIYNGEFTKK